MRIRHQRYFTVWAQNSSRRDFRLADARLMYKEHADGAQKEKMRVLRLPGSSNVELESNNWSYNEFFQFPTPIPFYPSLLLIISHLELTLNLSDTPGWARQSFSSLTEIEERPHVIVKCNEAERL